MRQQIDCAVLRLAAHKVWLEDVLSRAAPALARVKLHQLEWEAGQDLDVSSKDLVTLPVHALAQAGISLRRFDLCLLPVSVETLAWTRQALALIPRGPFLPLVGIFQNLKSAAMQDLLELGVSDFVRLPLCPDEFRARVLTTVSRVPRPGTLREPEPGDHETQVQAIVCAPVGKPIGHCAEKNPTNKLFELTPVNESRIYLSAKALKSKSGRGIGAQRLQSAISFNAANHQAELSGSFRDEKNKVVSSFERDYISRALAKHCGNIAMAARASNKHRRAFWALMRKHEIAAELYRTDSDEE